MKKIYIVQAHSDDGCNEDSVSVFSTLKAAAKEYNYIVRCQAEESGENDYKELRLTAKFVKENEGKNICAQVEHYIQGVTVSATIYSQELQ